jgi:hypothetical protein
MHLCSRRWHATGWRTGGLLRLHSITSSARVRRAGGTVTRSALAVLRLITSRSVVGWRHRPSNQARPAGALHTGAARPDRSDRQGRGLVPFAWRSMPITNTYWITGGKAGASFRSLGDRLGRHPERHDQSGSGMVSTERSFGSGGIQRTWCTTFFSSAVVASPCITIGRSGIPYARCISRSDAASRRIHGQSGLSTILSHSLTHFSVVAAHMSISPKASRRRAKSSRLISTLHQHVADAASAPD